MVTPTARRGAVGWIRDRFGLSERRACRLAGVSRSVVRYESKRDDREIRARLLDLAAEQPRFGYRRLHVLLCRERQGVINLKRVHRIYREENLAVRRKRRKRVGQASRRPRSVPERANERWSMDFMSDSLSDGRQFRTLNVIDDGTRECLAIEVDTSLGGWRVCRVLDRIAERRPLPKRIVIDHGTEFTSKALDQWAHRNQVELCFIRPGKPIENCFVESFNGKLRDECLNLHWFRGLAEARVVLEDWRWHFNHERPHSSLGNATPAEHAEALAQRAEEESADVAA